MIVRGLRIHRKNKVRAKRVPMHNCHSLKIARRQIEKVCARLAGEELEANELKKFKKPRVT
jgi:hypothetical protein